MRKSIFILLLLITSFFTISAQNWKPLAAGLLPTNYDVYGISAIGDKIVWAAASVDYFQGPIPNTHYPYILRSSDGGEHWTVKAVEEAAGTIASRFLSCAQSGCGYASFHTRWEFGRYILFRHDRRCNRTCCFSRTRF